MKSPVLLFALLSATVAAGEEITLENWQRQPFSQRSFLDVSQIVKTTPVRRGSSAPARFVERSRELLGLRFLNPDGNSKTMLAMLEDTDTNALVVLHRGWLIAEYYFNGMKADRPHLSQSAGKSFLGALFGIFVERGLVDVRAPVSTFVPELEESAFGDATVKQLLDMTCGVRYREEYSNPSSEVWRHEVSHAWKPNPGTFPASLHAFLPTLTEKERPHGELFHDCSANTDVLAWILEKTTGKPLAQLMSEEIWQPMGAEFDAYYTVDSAGTACANGGFGYTARDGARFGQMMLQHGRFNGRQIVPVNWAAASRTPTEKTRRAWASDGNKALKLMPRGGYSNQWWLWDIETAGRNHQPTMVALGSFGQRIFIDFATDVVIVKLSTQENNAMPELLLEEMAAFEQIAKTLSAPPSSSGRSR